MAIYYGSAVQGANNTTFGGIPPSSTRSISHARKRTTISVLDATPTTSDTIIVGFIKSSDLLIDITMATDGNATAGALNAGLSSVEFANGADEYTVVDADLFATAFFSTTAITYGARATMWESGTLDVVMDRGKSMWELAALGAATYTEDPGLTFAITCTPSTSFDAAQEFLWEISYVAGD